MRLIFTILTLFATTAATAQNEQDAIREVINNLFQGMRKSDTSLIRTSFTPDAILQTVARTRDGNVRVRSEVLDSFLVAVARPHPAMLDERIQFETVKVDGDLAMVWTPYAFFIGDTFSHCGVNSFQLVRIGGNWKIQYLIDTRRKQPCAAASK
ncbi:MAG TPA: nuclear transport factor 2 family protein [Flavisolibacter sp.]